MSITHSPLWNSHCISAHAMFHFSSTALAALKIEEGFWKKSYKFLFLSKALVLVSINTVLI